MIGEEDPAKGQSMVSDIAYRDYVVLLCSLDAEWSRRRFHRQTDELAPFRRVLKELTTKCWRYGQDISKNYAALTKANGGEIGEPLSRYLFNPAYFYPFSHADVMAIVLLDDFDPLHHVTASATTTIEDVCLGFCPVLESLDIDTNGGLFCELHTMLGGGSRVREPVADDRGNYEPAVHDFQTSTPLLVFTKYKMDGLGAVGQGLLFQQALFRAMAREIERVAALLLDELADSQSNAARLMSRGDVKATRCVLLDLQGSEEVGTLIVCRNYSVAASLMAGLRGLTYDALFHPEIDRRGTLRDLLGRSRAHQAIIHHGWQAWGNKTRPVAAQHGNIDLLRASHVFRWTHSVVGVAWSAFSGEDRANCRGYVEAVSEFQLSPGHCTSAERKVLRTPLASTECDKPRVAPAMFRPYLIGVGDLPVRHTLTGDGADADNEASVEPRASHLLPMAEVVKIVRENLRRFGWHGSGPASGRDVTDFTTSITIPIPKVDRNGDRVFEEKRDPHFSPLSVVLAETQRRLCYLGELDKDELRQVGPRPGRLDLHRLRQETRKYGLPVSLRRTIEYLYQNFATLFADPFLFDIVLDLYDSFATLHAVLTDHLPRMQQPIRKKDAMPYRRLLNEDPVVRFSWLVEAIHNALDHRMFGAYPETPIRDTAIDIRGGLNQILMAADAPVKCGLGLLRKFVQCRQRRDAVGALTKVQFTPGASFHILTFGTEQWARLGFLAGDVPHVLHVASYCDYLHEAFHLIFDELGQQRRPNWPFDNVENLVMRERLSEVFVTFLTQVFLFGGDVQTFRRHSVIRYSKSVASVGVDDAEVIMRVTEMLLRLFLATDTIETMTDQPVAWPERYPTREGDHPDAASDRFKVMVDDVGPFFSEYERLWQGPKRDHVTGYCAAQFRAVYGPASSFLPLIWDEAMTVYRGFVDEAVGGAPPSGDPADRLKKMQADLDTAIEESISHGKAIIRGACHDDYRSGEDRALDPLLLISSMLRHYIAAVRTAEGKDLHLYRDPATGDVDFRHRHNWHEFLIDRGAALMFCPVPTARRRRLRKQIAILKTFWDISSSLRARRLSEIMEDNWPRVPDAPA